MNAKGEASPNPNRRHFYVLVAVAVPLLVGGALMLLIGQSPTKWFIFVACYATASVALIEAIRRQRSHRQQ
jgi:membrane protein implicated in regulation of membrane protease activity